MLGLTLGCGMLLLASGCQTKQVMDLRASNQTVAQTPEPSFLSAFKLSNLNKLNPFKAKPDSELSLRKIRSNPSPELKGMANNHWYNKNIEAITRDVNRRQLSDDVNTVLFLTEPSKMSYYVVP